MFNNKHSILFFLFFALIIFNVRKLPANDFSAKRGLFAIFSDRDVYIAGERIYFKVYLDISAEKNIHGGLVGYVLRSSIDKSIHTGILTLTNNMAYGSFNIPDTLSTGFYQLVCFTNTAKHLGEASYAAKQLVIANRFDREPEKAVSPLVASEGQVQPALPAVINFSGNGNLLRSCKKEYNTRERISITINPALSERGATWLSLSVSETDGMIYYPGKQVSGNSLINGLKINQKDKLARNNALLISGEVTDKLSGIPVKNIDLFLTSPDSIIYLLHTTSDEDGSFHFILNAPEREVFINLKDPELQDNSIIRLFDKFSIEISELPVPPFLNESVYDHIRKSQDIVSINRHFDISFHIDQDKPEENRAGIRPRLYSNPVSVIKLDDYLPFSDLREIAREIIPGWRIRQRDERLTSNLINVRTRQYFNDEPALFLDGVHIGHLEDIISFGSAELYSIEIHNMHWRYGETEFQGIISINSRSNLYKSVVSSRSFASFKPPSLTYPSTLILPFYNEKTNYDNIPDLRQTLFWKPDIFLNHESEIETISFYTGDLTGDFKVIIEGVTDEGDYISKYINIRIK
ncbi:MAG: hypothetical protein ACFCUM_08110 [Bacteroidales bacterium]